MAASAAVVSLYQLPGERLRSGHPRLVPPELVRVLLAKAYHQQLEAFLLPCNVAADLPQELVVDPLVPGG